MLDTQPAMHSLARLVATPVTDVWGYLAATFPAGTVVSGVGVGVFVIAILRDKLLTSGQHLRRVADIVAAHELALKVMADSHAAILVAKEAAYAEMKGQRDYYREARIEERDRAEKATNALGEMVDVVKANNHFMGEFVQVAKEAGP